MKDWPWQSEEEEERQEQEQEGGKEVGVPGNEPLNLLSARKSGKGFGITIYTAGEEHLQPSQVQPAPHQMKNFKPATGEKKTLYFSQKSSGWKLTVSCRYLCCRCFVFAPIHVYE